MTYNIEDYTEIGAEELIELDKHYNSDNEWPKLTKSMHPKSFCPMILIDHQDGRKEFYTIETAQKAKKLQEYNGR